MNEVFGGSRKENGGAEILKRVFKRALAILVAFTVLLSTMPAYAALSMEEIYAYENDEELRLAVLGDDKWVENYPNGLFNFIGGNLTVNESQEFLDFAVVRQGGTQGEVSVDFKIVDVTARYGEDYVIKILEGGIVKAAIPADKTSVPLIEAAADPADVNISADPNGTGKEEEPGVSGDASGEAGAPADATDDTQVPADVVDNSTGAAINGPLQQGVYTDLNLIKEGDPVLEQKSGGMSLRAAKEAYTGTASDRPNWKEVDKGSVEALKASYDGTLGSLPGAKATLTFGDGEYIKYLRLIPKNNTISQSDRQSVFMLENPTSGSCRGEFYMSTVTIKDDEEPESSRFEIDRDSVKVAGDKASVVVKRTGGVERYASVYIGTEEGTAVAGADYAPGLSELFFTPGVDRLTVSVDLLPNQYRTEERQFTIALNREDANVVPEKAAAGIIIPSMEGAKTPDEVNQLLMQLAADEPQGRSISLFAVNPANGAEKISKNGRSEAKGEWLLTANDFINGGNRSGGYASGDDLRFTHTGNSQWAHAMASSEVKLFGVDRLEYRYSNVGSGRQEAYKVTQGSGCSKKQVTKYRTVYDMYLDFEIDSPGAARKVNGHGGQPESNTVANATLNPATQWNNNWIGFWSHVNNGSTNTNVTITPVKLYLKEYTAKTIEADKLQKTTYKFENVTLKKESDVLYSPGSIALREVLSNVNNNQSVNSNRAQASVYRSDRINIEVKYSADNPNGKYAYYDGFKIKNGGSWVEFRGATTLDIDRAFFQKPGVIDAIKSGTMEIKPIFVQRNAKLRTSFNPTLGFIQGIGAGNPDVTFDRPLFVGDKVSLLARPNAVSMTPSWSAKTGANTNGSGLSPNAGVIEVTAAANSQIMLKLENAYTDLAVGFSNPTLQVMANPNVYGVRTTNPEYYVDGVKYYPQDAASQKSFTDKMQDVYNKQQNPAIKMVFNCFFEPGDIGENKKAMFGTPTKAVLTIYKSDGSIRSTKEIPYNNGFTLTGNLKDLGWEFDDTASVIIYGSVKNGLQLVSTRESVVNFMSNSQNAVVVTSPDKSVKGGDIQTAVTVANALPIEQYRLDAYTANNFVTKWSDYSVDLNNDGNESQSEKDAAINRLKALGYMGSLDNARDLTVYYGNAFFVKPQFFDPTKIFYNFEKKSAEGSRYDVYLKLIQTGGTILDPNIPMVPRPIRNAPVIIVDKEINYDEANDLYWDRDPIYQERTNYLGRVRLEPYEYFFKVTSGTVTNVYINASEIMPPVNFNVKMPDGNDVDFNGKTTNVKTRSVDIKSGNTTFSYRFDNTKTGVTPNKSIIRIYDGTEVKATYTTGKPDSTGLFTYSLDTLAAGIKPGWTMSIAGVWETMVDGVAKSQEFPEVHAGFTFSRTLTALTVAASFKTPVQPVLKLFGKINNAYDLGADVEVDKYLTQSSYTDDNNLTRYLKTISFGFSQDFEKKITDSVKDNPASPSDPTPASPSPSDPTPASPSPSDPTPASPSPSDPTAPKKNFLREKLGSITGYDNMVKEVKDAQAKGKTAERGQGEGAATLKFSISLAIVLERGQTISPVTGLYVPDGSDYFSSLVLTATADATFSYTYTYVTPIGIPVMASIDASGSAVAAYGMEAEHSDPYAAKYRFDGEGNISFNPTNYSTYVKFQVTPTIVLGAGVGFSFLNLKVSGGASFDFSFFVPITGNNNASTGTGGVVFTAKLSIKILFIQKSWTLYKSDRISLFEYGSKASMMSLMSNPYQDYLYQSVGEIRDEDIMDRDYLGTQSEWLGGSPQSKGRMSLMSIETGDEKVVQNSAYPYPQTKIVNLTDTKKMMLFISDDRDRDARNRAVLMYTIGENGVWSEPKAVSNDGTWDESPDAFLISGEGGKNGKVLITWSDASRTYTESDTQKDILMAMDISAKWYDIDSDTLDTVETEITKTVKDPSHEYPDDEYAGEECADTLPMISYDEATKRLLVYYTKIDLQDDQSIKERKLSDSDTVPIKENQDIPLYGDIINGYSVIAYRYAELDNNTGMFVWNTTYEQGEGFDTIQQQQYYGQRLLNLAIPATITETVDSSNMVTNQTAVYDTSNPTDPRVIDSDLISYNGLAIYAYTVDIDANLKTTNDRKLFVQIYNYESKEFHHPMMMTVKPGLISSPKFVRSRGVTYLYWLQNGDIVYTDISGIVQNEKALEEVTIKDSNNNDIKIYILNKIGKTEDAYENIAIKQQKDNPIGEFMIRSNEEGIYILWPQTVITYKNGLKAGEPGTEKPENMIKETQIFAAFSVPHRKVSEWEVNADGQLPADMSDDLKSSLQSDLDASGKNRAAMVGSTVKYEVVDNKGYDWSVPVQVTFDPGVNFGDVSFAVEKDNSLTLSYVKFAQEFTDGVYAENENNRTLAVRNIQLSSTTEISPVKILDAEALVGGATALAEVSIGNTGVKPIEGGQYQAYMVANGLEVYTGDWTDIQSQSGLKAIVGGSTVTISGAFVLPEDISNVEIGFRFNQALDNVTAKTPVEAKAKVVITINSITQLSAEKAAVNISAVNSGNLPFSGNLTVKTGDAVLHTENTELAVNEHKDFDFTIGINNSLFGATIDNEDGGLMDSIPLTILFNDDKDSFEAQDSVTRRAGKALTEDFKNIKGINLKLDGSPVESVVYISSNRPQVMSGSFEYGTALAEGRTDSFELKYESSDSSVVTVLNDGTLVPMKAGRAVVTVTAQSLNTSVVSEVEAFEQAAVFLPKGLTVSKDIIVEVDQTSGSGTSDNVTPAPKYEAEVSGGNGIKLDVKVDKNNASVELTSAQGESGKELVVNMPKIPQATTYTLGIPASVLSKDDGNSTVTLKTAVGNIVLPPNMLAGTDVASGSKAQIGIGTVKTADLPQDVQNTVGNRPIVSLNLTVDGKAVAWNNPNAPVKVSIPYIPSAEELKNPEGITIWYIDDNGNMTEIQGAKYDKETQSVVFTTTHFSYYAIGYKTAVPEFTDVLADAWYYKAVKFIVEKGISSGTGNGKFSPDAELTRGQFIVMLMKAYGIEEDKNPNDNFSDAGNTWYTGYLAAAKAKGISKGIGGNLFAPEKAITRQEMFTLLYNVLKTLGKLPETDTGKTLEAFQDNGNIASWAREAMTVLVKAGTISGSGDGKLDPTKGTTRAQMAQVLYNLLGK